MKQLSMLQAQMDRRFNDLHVQLLQAESSIQRQFDAVERATNLAREANDKRLEAMNEFRQQLNQQAGTFISRAESDVSNKALGERIANIEKFAANIGGRVWAVGMILASLQIILHFLKFTP